MSAQQPANPIGVPAAICLGLVASFIQSLGLTIQRKSHLQNEALPAPRRTSEWKRPLWLVGFAIFLCANVGGTVFQIGALPIVILAPLGAVSLLYNALLARYLLNDFLSGFMITGTVLIASGAVLIGYFGVVPSPVHDLDELLELYCRPAFVAFATIFTFLFIGVLAVSHLAEWQLHARMDRASSGSKTKTRRHTSRSRLRRRWSAPSLAPVAEVSESSSGIATPVLAVADEMARRSIVHAVTSSPAVATNIAPLSSGEVPGGPGHYGSIAPRAPQPPGVGGKSSNKRGRRASPEASRLEARQNHRGLDAKSIRKTKLTLSVAYAGASGTMSGACLLLAKSGVELLMLTFSGQNQFARWQSWMLILILLGAALMQLWYLNKALKLSDPTLVCPLAFSSYNTSSIALGLVYFDQLDALAWYDVVAVIIGISVLLAGVWIVSLHGSDGDDQEAVDDSPLRLSSSSSSSVNHSSSTTEQTEGLLANAAGIAGPHLPIDNSSSNDSISSDSASDLSIDTQLSSLEAINTQLPRPSPSRSAAHSRQISCDSRSTSQNGGASAHQRRRSSSGSLRRPTITLDFPIDDSVFMPPSSSNDSIADVEGHAEHPCRNDDPEQAGDDTHNALLGRHTRQRSTLYNTIVERGLSIGLSPSSPGFHLQPRSPVQSKFPSSSSGPIYGTGGRKRLGRHPRRAMSEADAGALSRHPLSLTSGEENGDMEQAEQAEDGGTSGFGIEPDQSLLWQKLERLRLGGASGWNGFKRIFSGGSAQSQQSAFADDSSTDAGQDMRASASAERTEAEERTPLLRA